MSRGGSYGGGQSSLGYLFSSDEKPNPTPVSKTVTLPPYGIDTVADQSPPKSHRSPPNLENQHNIISNNYQRSEGQNSGNFITVSSCSLFFALNFQTDICLMIIFGHYFQGRPSTKVSSAPGGDSSLGYLFGDK